MKGWEQRWRKSPCRARQALQRFGNTRGKEFFHRMQMGKDSFGQKAPELICHAKAKNVNTFG
jgi:hypothetical protein